MALVKLDQRSGVLGGSLGGIDTQNIVSVAVAYQSLPRDDIISANGTFDVTLPPFASAVKQITIQCITGLITIVADATIQAPTSVSAASSVTVFPAGGQWWHK